MLNIHQLAEKNKEKIIDTIKVLTFKEDNSLFEKIDFEDDNIFLEPLLFSYFNSKKDGKFPTGIMKEILRGYYKKNEKVKVKYSFNKNKIAYLPKIGYFQDGQKEIFEEILIKDDFEILKEIHPTQEKYFIEASEGHVIDNNPSHNSVWKDNCKVLFEAIDIIKEHIPEFYKELVFANRRIYLHDNPKILNFTTLETLGTLYFYVLGEQNVIYFIEELIHQGAHNYLYYVVHNREDFFKIDIDNLNMRDYSKQQWDYRTIYSAFHGLFTVSRRVKYFDKLLQKNIFKGRDKHELLGRTIDQYYRFRTGLELLNINEVFTERGAEFYRKLDSECEATLEKYKFLKSEFDLSNRQIDFRYNDFCKLNPFNTFVKNDEKGLFNF